jgi:hypothetical protein
MPRGDRCVRQWQLLRCIGRPCGLTIADAAVGPSILSLVDPRLRQLLDVAR